jgi:hypothetical protein
MSVRTETLVISVITVVADPLARGFPAQVEFDAIEKLFEFYAQRILATLHFTLDAAAKKIITGYACALGRFIDLG